MGPCVICTCACACAQALCVCASPCELACCQITEPSVRHLLRWHISLGAHESNINEDRNQDEAFHV
jgi:hypothetical protein